MIVCPMIRSVGLKAATASSKGRDLADANPQSSVPHKIEHETGLANSRLIWQIVVASTTRRGLIGDRSSRCAFSCG